MAARPNSAGAAVGDDPLTDADRLVRDGRLVEAVDLLAAANRLRRDPAVEIRLVDLRHEAACALDPGQGRSPWPPAYPDPFPEVARRPPEVECSDLNETVLGGAVAHHGCLVVRGLFDDEQAARTIDAIHRTEARRDGPRPDGADGAAEAWYRPFEPLGDIRKALRRMVIRQGGSWLADSPASTAQVLDDLASSGAIAAIADHLGERPFFSLQKSTLRRSPPVFNFTSWHQDGSFLGPEVRTMNVWIALSRCGGDHPSPGLQIVPKRVHDLLPTDGGLGTASISEASVYQAAADAPVMRPEFDPGDALLFDEHFLHSTYLHPDMTEARYALECWLFAPSHASDKYLPFLV